MRALVIEAAGCESCTVLKVLAVWTFGSQCALMLSICDIIFWQPVAKVTLSLAVSSSNVAAQPVVLDSTSVALAFVATGALFAAMLKRSW